MYEEKDKELTREELEEERRYGAFWYSWAWTVLRPVLMGVCVLLVVVGIVMSVVNKVHTEFFDAVDEKDARPVTFTVESGSSLTRVANNLEKAGLIRNGTLFRYYADLLGFGQKIQAGTYQLSRDMKMTDIMDMLTTGDGNPITRRITVIPGWTVEDMAKNLFTKEEDRAEFLRLCRTGNDGSGNDFSVYFYIGDAMNTAGHEKRPYILEGYLAADTYEVYTDATVADIINKLLSQTNVVFPDTYLDRAEEIGVSMDYVITMASVIEKEAKTGDFAKVAAVFHNRLNTNLAQSLHRDLSGETKGMLQSDATIKYVNHTSRMNLTSVDKASDSPYNTYKYKGLPAGPICSPSQAAIRAVLYPDEAYLRDGYLFFCNADPESGKLVFAKTLKEHNENVERYRPLWEEFDRKNGNK